MKALAFLSAGLLLCACSGPQRSLAVGVQGYGTDVQFGSDAIQVAPPIAPGGLTLAPPPISRGLIGTPELPTPTIGPSLSPQPQPVPCPSADPFAVAKVEAGSLIPKPPKRAVYFYGNDGTYETSGATPTTLAYPKLSVRRVDNIATTTSGGFTFTVDNLIGNIVATTGYEYIPPSVAPVNSSTPSAGLYVTRIYQTSAGKVVSNFTATGRGLLVLQVPIVPGQAWTTSATDATTGATITAGVSEGAHTIVNACGAAVDAMPVHVDGTVQVQQNVAGQHVGLGTPGPSPSGGTNSQPLQSTSTTFTADYAFATQYGGLSVMDTVDESGTEGGVTVHSRNVSTIQRVPVAP